MLHLGWRLVREVSPRCLWKFAWNFGLRGMLAVRSFERRRRRGQYSPAFLFISVTDQCNLTCQGCWVTPSDPPRVLGMAVLRETIERFRATGLRFFGILGGEPLLYKGLTDLFHEFGDCYFQVFTNGLLLDETVAKEYRRCGNVTPLISIEGDELVSDVRRGGSRVMARSLAAVERCREAGLVTGIASSVCQSNIETVANRAFLDRAAALGAHYVWYYIYRPVGPRPCVELALSKEQILDLRRFMVNARVGAPVLVVDSYWDHAGRAVCPAVIGLAPHIGPGGNVEPCPPIQFSDSEIQVDDVVSPVCNSEFLARFRTAIAERTRGCILMDDPRFLSGLIDDCGAADASGRGTARQELDAMTCIPSHHIPGHEIPERSWFYRMAKRHWFFGFGAYG